MMFWLVQAQENPAEPRNISGRRKWRSNTLAETLADRGHDVMRWRSAFSHQAKRFLAQGNTSESHDNYTQRFIACPSYKRHVGLARIRNHRALGVNFLKIARSCSKPDLIHVGNVPIELAHAAVRYGTEVGCPVVIDIRDLWPDSYVDLIPKRLAFLRMPVLKLLKHCSFQLKWTMRNAAALSVMTDSFLEWGLEFADRPKNHFDAVFPMCYPVRDSKPSDEDLAALYNCLGLAAGDVVATYLGNIGYQSDFALVIEAAKRISQIHPKFKVVIAGSGPSEEMCRRQASDTDNVIVPGWLKGDQIATLQYLSKIGLLPYFPSPSFMKSISNKYPEYLAGGMAIACGIEGEMGRMTREFQCGFVYPTGDLDKLCSQLLRLLDAPDVLDDMRMNAKALHASRFDSANIYPAFANHLECIAKKGPFQGTNPS